MQITINIQIFAAIFFFILTRQIKIYAYLMLFILIHECAHMCIGLILHLKPKTIEIEPFGFGIILEDYDATDKKRIIIALAGPVINFITAIIFMVSRIETKDLVVNSNVLLALFNLLPMYPLDGGRILKALLRIKSNGITADEITNKTANILMILVTAIASVLILVYKNIGIFLIILYLWILRIKENKRYYIKKRIMNLIEKEKYT